MKLGDKGGQKGAVLIFPMETVPRRADLDRPARLAARVQIGCRPAAGTGCPAARAKRHAGCTVNEHQTVGPCRD